MNLRLMVKTVYAALAQGQVQGHKICPQGVSRPRLHGPGGLDYIIGNGIILIVSNPIHFFKNNINTNIYNFSSPNIW